jgi:hypothetical protein
MLGTNSLSIPTFGVWAAWCSKNYLSLSFFKTLKVSKKEWEFLSDMPSKCPAHVLIVLECDLIKYDAKCDKVFKLS